MTATEEHRLTEGQRKLVEDNRFLAIDYAKRLAGGTSYFDDFLSEAYLGMVRAASDYTPDKGCFTTWAYFWIRHKTLRFVQDKLPIVRVPQYLRYRNSQRLKSHAKLGEQAKAIIDSECMSFAVSTEVVCSRSRPDEDAGLADDLRWLADQIDQLSNREQFIIRRRLAGETNEQIGQTIGLTKERVRQIEIGAIELLRKIAGRSRAIGGVA